MDYISVSAMFWVITILCVLNPSEAASTRDHLRIIAGHDVAEGEYPFVVLLVTKKKKEDVFRRFCSASAISQEWVLSAGHCVENKDPQKIFVWHTNFTIPAEKSKLVTKVRKTFKHPALVHHKEIGLSLYNDIGLLLVEELALAGYGRLLAVDHLTMVGLPVTYVGGGRTSHPKYDALRPLQVGNAVITTCAKRIARFDIYSICLASKCSKRRQVSHSGDSGGPLLFKGKIIGVCSYGRKSRRLPKSAFAPVSPYIDWIYNVIHKNA